MKKIASFLKISKKIALFFGISKQIVLLFWKNLKLDSAKLEKKQYYRKVGLGNPPPTTYCLSYLADKEKPKAAFVCHFRNKLKAINSW